MAKRDKNTIAAEDDLQAQSEAKILKESAEEAETKKPNVKFVGRKRQLIKESEFVDEQDLDPDTGEVLIDTETGEPMMRRTAIRQAGTYEMVPIPDDEAPTRLTNGLKTIDLPDGATQKAGFYHPEGAFLRANYRKLYKRPEGRTAGEGMVTAGPDAENASQDDLGTQKEDQED